MGTGSLQVDMILRVEPAPFHFTCVIGNSSDGSYVSRNPRTGDVLAKILLKSTKGDAMAVLTSFSSPWNLANGSFYDLEVRNESGDNAFMAVTTNVNGATIESIKDSFFLESLLAPTGRFSFYGQPTDVKVKK